MAKMKFVQSKQASQVLKPAQVSKTLFWKRAFIIMLSLAILQAITIYFIIE